MSTEVQNPAATEPLFPVPTSETTSESLIEHSTSMDLQDAQTGPINLNFSEGALQLNTVSTGVASIGDITIGNEMSGRMSVKAKKQMIEQFGGNSATEAAVVA